QHLKKMPGRTPPYESRLARFHRTGRRLFEALQQINQEGIMDQRIINLYHHFTHGGMNRRQFLDRLTEIVGSATAAAALVPLLQNDYARAAIVAADDERLAGRHGV